VTIDELHWFVVLAESENMTEASARLNITQPALSRALARLEHRLHARLFDRVNRRLRLNRHGEILLEHARRCLAEFAAAEERITALVDPARGTVRLAFLHSVSTWLVPEMLRRYREERPAVRFELRQAPGYQNIADLRDGLVDLAVTAPRPAEPDIAWHPLHRERLCLAVPADHPLAGRHGCSLTEVAGEPFVALRVELGMREISDELCAHAGFAPAIAFESSEIASMEGLVAAGLGVAIVPTPRAHRATPGVYYLPLSDPGAHRVIGLASPCNLAEPPVVHRFAEFVRAHRWE
jgi:LysR family transcriptional regulator, transcription activator of glutamate synthase operon